MNDQLPAPLVPADVDLRGLDYMPLFGNHLFGSEFNAMASDEAWRAGVTLWWAAWNQQPAGSLPDNDVALCRLADLGRDVKGWKQIRDVALRGFTLCSDGRLYHPFLCKQALIAWDKRVKERDRKAEYRAKKAAEKAGQSADVPRDKPGTKPGTDTGTGEGQDADVPADGNGRDVTGRDVTSKPKPPDGEVEGKDRPEGSAPPVPPDAHEPVSMRADWQPSPHFASLAKLSGLTTADPESLAAATGEFVAYWLTKPLKKRTQHEWDHALVKSLKSEKTRSTQQPQGAPNAGRSGHPRPLTATERNIDVIAKLTGRDREPERPAIDGTAERVG